MAIVINGKVKSKNIARKFTLFYTTDGREWPDAKIATKWQEKLNKTAQSVLDGKYTMNGTRKVSKAPRKVSQWVFVSEKKRLAIKNFVNQTGSQVGSGGVLSVNRLVQSLEKNPKLLSELQRVMKVK